MARGSSALPVVLLALAALFVAPAFVPTPAPRAAPEATVAAISAGAVLPLLTAQPAMAEERAQSLTEKRAVDCMIAVVRQAE